MDKQLLEDLQEYIQERINNNNISFKKNKRLQKLIHDTNNIYEKISEENSTIKAETVQKLYDNLINISAEENYISYRIGFVDGINIDNNIKGLS